MNNNKVWYITGVTSGSGYSLTQLLLEQGYKVIGTSRSSERIDSLPFKTNDNFLGIKVDLTCEQNVKHSIDWGISKFGGIDVIVNNAGQGVLGNVEEITGKEQKALMDAMYFGPSNVIRSVLPHFRSKNHGLIFNVSSVFGTTVNVPLFSAYCSAKSALNALTDCLSYEVKPFGINVVTVVLGFLNTNFSNPLTGNLIPCYNLESTFDEMCEEFKKHPKGSPVEFAKFLIENSKLPSIPKRIYFGENPIGPNFDFNKLNQQAQQHQPIDKQKQKEQIKKDNKLQLPLHQLHQTQKQIKGGNIHMPYALHE